LASAHHVPLVWTAARSLVKAGVAEWDAMMTGPTTRAVSTATPSGSKSLWRLMGTLSGSLMISTGDRAPEAGETQDTGG
jgi:hypothetical protein